MDQGAAAGSLSVADRLAALAADAERQAIRLGDLEMLRGARRLAADARRRLLEDYARA